MALFWRSSPTGFARVWAGLCLASIAALASVPAPARAQALDALDAANPERPVRTLPLVLPSMSRTDTPALPGDIAEARALWQRVNQRVAEFPRGHADLLRWESNQPDATPSATPRTGDAMDFNEALRLSLRHRPELFTHADMNPLVLRQVGAAYAEHVRDLRQAWIRAVAARQSERLLNEMLSAARAGSELGRRMVVAGNWSQARQMNEHMVEARAWQASLNAQEASLASQEQLAQKLGLWEMDAVARLGERIPDQLPALPERPWPSEPLSIEAAVLQSHPTLAQTRLVASREMAAPSPARRQAWAEAVDAAVNVWEADAPPHIDNLSLLRDPVLARAVNAETALLQQASERRALARQTWRTLQLRHVGALHAQNVIAPLQSALAQETQLRYNGMLQSTWELLASARERLASLDAALQARRDYWLARADWQALLAGVN